MDRLFIVTSVLLWVTPLMGQGPATFKGRSTCEKSLLNPPGSYGVRLDASQNAYLEARRFEHRYLLFIVQSESKDKNCGRIIDVVQASRARDYFVFDCEDATSPGDVVVGSWPHKRKPYRGPATAAWKVDLGKLQFVPLHVPAQCVIQGRSGTDEGGDLRSDAEKRAAAR